MEDNAPAPKSEDKPITVADTKPIEQQISAVKEEIAETPKEEQDKEWRENLNSTLAQMSNRLEALIESKGKNPELTAMEQQISRLVVAIEKLQETRPESQLVPPSVSPNVGDESLIPVTPTETLSVPPIQEERKKKKVGWL